MKISKKLGCISLLVLSPFAVAMQPLDDENLSEATGQSGINVGIGVSKVQIDQLSIIDRDGLGTNPDYKNAASLVLAGNIAGTVSGQKFALNFIGSTGSSTINAVFDTDGGARAPFANIALSFDKNIKGISLGPLGLYLAGVSSTSMPGISKSIFTGTSRNSDVQKFLTANNGIDINFGPSAPTINLQLGNVPQSQFIKFAGSISSICGNGKGNSGTTGSGCGINIISDGGVGGDIGAKFDFMLSGSDKVQGFSLSGFYAGVEPSGFVFGNTGESSKFDVGLNNVIMGNAGATNTSGAFANIQNGSMGNLGAVGTSVTDLKVRISGL
ncbi:DUF6160 family protein [Acinetobacter wuhouensis]|uniref:FilA n=1 Tax=Acinetobacter wuhouensis TaxID=1879050 RepID=A0A4Q7AGG4_9GAMM|nr:DUF6160 family protein [Acinetobacter wuhouensis]RZG46635.1 FilA [Acinetobacter wuhouensis]RZG72391.1 FilA [Acinetobacter wuhouensis]